MNKLKKIREERGLSQEQLARMANLSKQTISNLELGRQNFVQSITLAKLSRALNVPPQEFFTPAED